MITTIIPATAALAVKETLSIIRAIIAAIQAKIPKIRTKLKTLPSRGRFSEKKYREINAFSLFFTCQ
jgi:hypothetical protein